MWDSLNSGYRLVLIILDAMTGETLHALLKDQNDLVYCTFVVNSETLFAVEKRTFFDCSTSDQVIYSECSTLKSNPAI